MPDNLTSMAQLRKELAKYPWLQPAEPVAETWTEAQEPAYEPEAPQPAYEAGAEIPPEYRLADEPFGEEAETAADLAEQWPAEEPLGPEEAVWAQPPPAYEPEPGLLEPPPPVDAVPEAAVPEATDEEEAERRRQQEEAAAAYEAAREDWW